jgi:hypothetical protein
MIGKLLKLILRSPRENVRGQAVKVNEVLLVPNKDLVQILDVLQS